jgi:Nitronate monooxygenase
VTSAGSTCQFRPVLLRLFAPAFFLTTANSTHPSISLDKTSIKMTTIATPLTKLFKIKHPIFLAGMNVAAGPGLAAAVTNAGGLGVIGGVG